MSDNLCRCQRGKNIVISDSISLNSKSVSFSLAAVRPVVLEGMFMAIVFSHEKRLTDIGRAIEELRMEMNPEKQEGTS